MSRSVCRLLARVVQRSTSSEIAYAAAVANNGRGFARNLAQNCLPPRHQIWESLPSFNLPAKAQTHTNPTSMNTVSTGGSLLNLGSTAGISYCCNCLDQGKSVKILTLIYSKSLKALLIKDDPTKTDLSPYLIFSATLCLGRPSTERQLFVLHQSGGDLV